ncbi:hypothetical protein SDC9_212178 [bioreactor metagenome]|uniref:Uncharacterized protein n=1 Tax=bioreactor metagenome TaxID=1076179 RepID=A0A645JLW0_9ZZZZ
MEGGAEQGLAGVQGVGHGALAGQHQDEQAGKEQQRGEGKENKFADFHI